MGGDTQPPSDVTGDSGTADESQSTNQPGFPSYDPQQLDPSRHSFAYVAGPVPRSRSQSGDEPATRGTRPSRYFEGICENADKLGISKADLLGVEAQSPFTAASFDENSLNDIPKSLVPSLIQRRMPYHPFLDCVPIPEFRDRAVLACSTNPPLINRFDLCYDMFAGGLTWREDPAVEENWQYSREFETKWRALLQMDVPTMQRHVEGSQPGPSQRTS